MTPRLAFDRACDRRRRERECVAVERSRPWVEAAHDGERSGTPSRRERPETAFVGEEANQLDAAHRRRKFPRWGVRLRARRSVSRCGACGRRLRQATEEDAIPEAIERVGRLDHHLPGERFAAHSVPSHGRVPSELDEGSLRCFQVDVQARFVATLVGSHSVLPKHPVCRSGRDREAAQILGRHDRSDGADGPCLRFWTRRAVAT